MGRSDRARRARRRHRPGRNRDGGELRFEGRLAFGALAGREAGDAGPRGEFTGLVGEEELFTMDCFRCSPVGSEPVGAPGFPNAPAPPTDTD